MQKEHARRNCNSHASSNAICSEISVSNLDQYLYTTGSLDDDTVVRTSGET